MDQVIQHWIDAGNKIKTIVSNFKKDPANRKTKEYFVERLRRIEAAWEEFSNHSALLKKNADFDQEFYNEIEILYQDYQRTFSAASKTEYATLPSNNKSTIGEAAAQAVQTAQSKAARIIRKQGASYYSVKTATVNNMWTQIEQLHLEMAEECDSSYIRLEKEYDEEEYYLLQDRVQEAIIDMSSQLMQPTIHQQQPTFGAELKLPRITIPNFDGDYLKWNQFKDLFTEMIHNQPISKI